jgi:hypothetical protein
VRAPRPMKIGQAKRYLADTIGKDKAALVWRGMDLDHAEPWSVGSLDDAVVAFDSLEEPFGEQTIHPDQGSLEDLVTDAVVGGER